MVVFDDEGVIDNPGLDFAWLCLRKYIPDSYRKYYEYMVKMFDEYDDLRWLYERDLEGHSTGTTPIIVLCILALFNINDDELIKYALKVKHENVGIDKVLIWILKELNIEVLIISNAYPAIPLLSALKYGIKTSNVYTSGFQYRTCIDVLKDMNDLVQEVYERSPLKILTRYRSELKNFLVEYLNICLKLRNEYLSRNERLISRLMRRLEQVVNSLESSELKSILKYLLYDEYGVMGGHNKRKVIEKRCGSDTIYLGDSIVDADALSYANYGVSINCVNKHALLASKLNIATLDYSELIHVINHILDYGLEKLEKLRRSLKNSILFTRDDIEKNLNFVIEINRKYRSILIENYSRSIKDYV
ncbi:MAG: hypothetical protein B6V02_00510 [Thermoprotei archaeon ex4572_64]|nr:MAG: hypothetical protein B6V02_00510 [Thermoprotei archaeon ex4572_64]